MAIPIGSVVGYSLLTAAVDNNEAWLYCDDIPHEIANNQNLFEVIGGAFGSPTSGQFNVPDLRGYFIRAPDSSPAMGPAGRDPDAATRTAMAPNGNMGDNVGSVQSFLVGPHAHNLENTWGAYWQNTPPCCTVKDSSAYPPSISHTLVNPADETRPVNAALTFFILADSPSQRFPLGSIISFAGNSDPVDHINGDVWLICDGRQFTREDYPAYWQLLHNIADSAQPNTFQIPDLRGIFLRGVDPTGILDPGVEDRTPMFPGGMGGGSVGSLQQDQFSSHQHPVPGEMSIDHDGDAQTQVLASPGNSGSAGPTDSGGENMGLETRPINAYLHQLIRVK